MVIFIWFVRKSNQVIFIRENLNNDSKVAFFRRIPSELIFVEEFESEYFVSDEISYLARCLELLR